MGANFITKTLKAKTSDKVRGEWKQILEDDLYENGHDGYSGSWGTMTLSMTNRVFNTFDEAHDRMSEIGDKGIAYAVQVKVAKLGKRFDNITVQIDDLTHKLLFSREALPTRTRNAMECKRTELYAKRKLMLEEAGAKSTKTEWVLMGWARS